MMNDDMMMKKDSKYKNETLRKKYKTSFSSRLWNSLNKIPVSKLETVSERIDKLIEQYETKNISDSKKETIISQLVALRELVDENLLSR